MSASALLELDSRLDSEDTAVVLAAVWDIFTVTAEVCHSITFEEGSDELQAMLASHNCATGRDLLPLPETGMPFTPVRPGPGAAGLEPYVRLLQHAGDSLDHLLTTADSVGEGAARALREAKGLATGASVALTRVRER